MDEENGQSSSCFFGCFTKPNSNPNLKKSDELQPEKRVDQKGCQMQLPAKLVGKRYYDEIWATIMQEGNKQFNIYGRTGVGKTTLLAYLNNQFLLHSYDFVIFVSRSRFLTTSYLLAEIAKQIGLLNTDLGWNQKPINKKREAISSFLSGKRYAILIDDFYFRYDLDFYSSLGLLENECKIVFAYELNSRLNWLKNIQLEPLEWEDSWCLFKHHTGEFMLHDPEISSLAAKIALLCQGLPEALVKIGRLMNSNNTLEEWQNAFEILKKFDKSATGTPFSLEFPRSKFEDVAEILCDELGKNSMFKARVMVQTKPFYDFDGKFRKIRSDLGELKDALTRLGTDTEEYRHRQVIKLSIDFIDGLKSYA
ncbi:Disease resistance protein (CC-NBS-LRR class) family [Euphorbia peplus]|nr:Disease resistance protein (CC-NBS-LRR class) family [Euphorbia peplus]